MAKNLETAIVGILARKQFPHSHNKTLFWATVTEIFFIDIMGIEAALKPWSAQHLVCIPWTFHNKTWHCFIKLE